MSKGNLQAGNADLLNVTVKNPLYSVFNKQVDKQQAAIFVCSAKLGDCYILQELIDSFLTDVETEFRKEGWFRHTIKQNFRKCRKSLLQCMALGRTNSASGADMMRAMSDQYTDRLQPKLREIVSGTEIELKMKKVPNARSVSLWLVADLMMRMCIERYNQIIEYMNKLVPAYYDSFFHNASCRAPYHFFELALREYDDRYVPMNVDANEINSLNLGISILFNQMSIIDNDESIKESVEEELGRDLGYDQWRDALQKLQLAV